MHRKALLTAATVLVALGILIGPAAAADTKSPTVKTPLQVTYYFLPG